LLRGGLIGVGLLATASVGLSLQRTRLIPVPREGLKVLSRAEYSILTAIARQLVPAEGGPGVAPIDVALLADQLLEHVEEDVVDGIKLALGLVESGLVGALLFEHVRPFTQLSAEAQGRALEWLRVSRIPLRRTIYRSFSGLAGSLYYGDPRAWPSVGYPGPPDPTALRTAYAGQLVDLAALRGTPPAEGG
jgi:hypothetical protein